MVALRRGFLPLPCRLAKERKYASRLYGAGGPEEEGEYSVTDELSLAELENELCEALPDRTLLCHRRSRNLSFVRRHHHHFNGGENFERGRDFGFFGGVSNFNSTNQSIFNPQTAIGFGGGGITQVGGNTNFNNSTQFGF
jgi:hypothetical protein